MLDKRTSPRQRMLKTGAIEFGGGSIDCTVRNVSTTGALLEIASPLGIPERFTLLFKLDRTRRPCRVVWRREQRMGVLFE